MTRPNDTIAAIATAAGEAAIAVIRVSGPQAATAADGFFRGSMSLRDARSHTVHYGRVVYPDGATVDDVLVTVFRAPHSYTGEDVVEIGCHGGLFVTQEVYRTVLASGIRQAEPGEFTRRAFLNGKMDLSQAEAVGALIAATSGRAHRASLEQLHGRLAEGVGEIREELVRLCALLELDLDFSEEGLTVAPADEITRKIAACKERLSLMADTFKTGRMYRDGVSVVIIGEPNVGKSSLFNALLRENRAIVTPVPGTTRDFLEESLIINGILFRLTDTAGIRESPDPIEREGIRRSKLAMEHADILLVVMDASASADAGTLESISRGEHQHLIRVWNKIDAAEILGSKRSPDNKKSGEAWISAMTGEGVHALSELLVSLVAHEHMELGGGVQITTHRHWESLRKAVRKMTDGLDTLKAGRTNEFVAFEIREAVDALGEITGVVTSEDVLNSVFASFCIGK
jgi:tRNA modification GTPase